MIYGEHCWGGHADLAVAPARNVVRRPAGRSWEECAAYPLAYLTAYRMLRRARLAAGETCSSSASARGVSCAALALGRHMGADVVGDQPQRGQARAGAGHGCGGGASTRPTAKWPVQADVVDRERRPGDLGAVGARAQGRAGAWCVCGGTSGPKVELNLPRLFFKQLEIIGSTMGSYQEFAERHRARRRRACRSRSTRSSRSPSTPTALERLEQGEQLGKIVLRHP